jgi:hypothetical protein
MGQVGKDLLNNYIYKTIFNSVADKYLECGWKRKVLHRIVKLRWREKFSH